MSAAPSLGYHLALAHGSWERGDPTRAVAKTIETAREAETAGIDALWASEDPDGWDAFAVLGALARETERVRLGTGVTNPFLRHPNLLAASVTTLDRLSNGRAFLGLGRGQTEWYEQGLGIAAGEPLRALRESFDLLEGWLGPQRRASADGWFHVHDWERTLSPVQAQRPPIYLAAVGPKALRLAGERADGVLFNDLSSDVFVAKAIAAVRTSAETAGRDPSRLRFFLRAGVEITDDVDAALERRKATVALIHGLPGMEALLETPGFDIPAIMRNVRRAMGTAEVLAGGGGFADLRRTGDMAAAKAAIPTDLMARLALVGPATAVRARLAQVAALGVTDVFLAVRGAPNRIGELVAALRA